MAAVLVLIILVVLYLLQQTWVSYTTRDGAPFVPLPASVIKNIINLAEVKEGDVFYDLGSGDGRVVIAAALKGAKAVGIELDPLRVWYSRFALDFLV